MSRYIDCLKVRLCCPLFFQILGWAICLPMVILQLVVLFVTNDFQLSSWAQLILRFPINIIGALASVQFFRGTWYLLDIYFLAGERKFPFRFIRKFN